MIKNLLLISAGIGAMFFIVHRDKTDQAVLDEDTETDILDEIDTDIEDLEDALIEDINAELLDEEIDHDDEIGCSCGDHDNSKNLES